MGRTGGRTTVLTGTGARGGFGIDGRGAGRIFGLT